MSKNSKYRGKSVETGEWVYGFYVRVDNDHYIYAIEAILVDADTDSYENHPVPYAVIPESVGQWIGLEDKNGVDIYQNHFVKDNHGRVMQIVWCEDQPDFTRKHFARFEFKLISSKKKWANNFLYAEFNSWFNHKTERLDVEVTDKPELLKE